MTTIIVFTALVKFVKNWRRTATVTKRLYPGHTG